MLAAPQTNVGLPRDWPWPWLPPGTHSPCVCEQPWQRPTLYPPGRDQGVPQRGPRIISRSTRRPRLRSDASEGARRTCECTACPCVIHCTGGQKSQNRLEAANRGPSPPGSCASPWVLTGKSNERERPPFAEVKALSPPPPPSLCRPHAAGHAGSPHRRPVARSGSSGASQRVIFTDLWVPGSADMGSPVAVDYVRPAGCRDCW